MIDLGHILLLILAAIAGVVAYQGTKQAKQAKTELDSVKFNQLLEGVKRDSLNQSDSSRLSKFNQRYGPGDGGDKEGR